MSEPSAEGLAGWGWGVTFVGPGVVGGDDVTLGFGGFDRGPHGGPAQRWERTLGGEGDDRENQFIDWHFSACSRRLGWEQDGIYRRTHTEILQDLDLFSNFFRTMLDAGCRVDRLND